MKLRLIAVGAKMPHWVSMAFQDYANRFPKNMPLELSQVPLQRRGKNADIKRILIKEGKLMVDLCEHNDHIVTLDIVGTPWNTLDLATQLECWKQKGQNVALLIGGPEGLSVDCKNAAHQSWSLSPLTLPHSLARVIVAESLYRAYSLTCHHPYHRE